MSKTWFKMYARDYLDGTRSMTLEQRGAYIDCICLIFDMDGPIPEDPRWLAHQLHISLQKAKKILAYLIDAQKLVKTNQGIDNRRAIQERMKRYEMCSRNKKIADDRERKKTEEKLKKVGEKLKKSSNFSEENFQLFSNFSEEKNEENSKNINKNNESNARVVAREEHPRAGARSFLDNNIKEKIYKKEKKTVATRLSENWELPSDWIEFIKSKFDISDRAIEYQADVFKNYWLSASGSNASKRDWRATFSNWVGKALQSGNVEPPTAWKAKKQDDIPFWKNPKIKQAGELTFRRYLEKYPPNGVWNEQLGPPPGHPETAFRPEIVKMFNLEKYDIRGMK